MSKFPTGWHNSPQAVQQYIAERSQDGDTAILADARPELAGFWRKTVLSGVFSVLLYEAECLVVGSFGPADLQRRGTCVGRGTYRAVQTGYWDAIAQRRIVGAAEQIAYEPIYGGSRVQVGKGQLSGDGSVGAWAAKWCHDYGVIERGVHGEFDLSRDREDLAVHWGTRGYGVPQSIIQSGKGHRCDAYHVADPNELADVTAARYASAICSTHQQRDYRDENGECAYQGPTAHCEAIVGVYMRPSWDSRPETIYEHTGFVDQQSWGNVPSGPDVLRMYKSAAKLRQGAYGTPMAAMRRRMPTGETWAFRLRDGFVSSTLAGTVV